MASITDAIGNLLNSFFDIIRALLNTVLGAIQSVFTLAQDLIASIFDLMSSAVGFVLGNIVIIGILVAAYVGYTAYRQKNQGGGITSGKKTT